jgi:hypothetical protein
MNPVIRLEHLVVMLMTLSLFKHHWNNSVMRVGRVLGGITVLRSIPNAYVSQGKDFCTVIAPKIVPHIYGRMLLLTLFYQASLRHYNDRLTEQTRLLVEENRNNRNIRLKEIQALRKDFISFTNVYWFHDVTV